MKNLWNKIKVWWMIRNKVKENRKRDPHIYK